MIYNSAKKKILDADIDFAVDTIKVMLVTDAYTPNIDTHEFRSSVTNEITGSGYTAGGATLANKTVTMNTTTDKGVFDADDVIWTTATITARGAVIYKDTGDSATDPVIAYIDFGEDKVSTASDFRITWNANGILTLA
jgi:hypothetical protein